MGVCDSNCCSLPNSTPIRIKACFTRCDLENITHSEQDLVHQENVSFISSSPMYKPHISFECDLLIGNTYHQFIEKLSKIVLKHIEFNAFIFEMQYIRYETSYGLQVYTFKHNKTGKDVTFNQLFYDLSFVDWSSGYSLIIWFDAKCFKTNLDKAIENGHTQKICKLLQITSNQSHNDNKLVTNNYIELQGEEEGDDITYYPFPIIERDVYGLLSMNDELITKHLIQLNNQKLVKRNNRKIDFNLDSNSLLLCVEQFYNVSKNILIEHDLRCLFKLSPFYAITWYNGRYIHVQICIYSIFVSILRLRFMF